MQNVESSVIRLYAFALLDISVIHSYSAIGNHLSSMKNHQRRVSHRLAAQMRFVKNRTGLVPASAYQIISGIRTKVVDQNVS